MRSQSFLRKTHSLLKQSVTATHPFPQAASCSPLRRHTLQFSNVRSGSRNLSTNPPSVEPDAVNSLPPFPPPVEVTHVEEINDKSEANGSAEEPDKAPTRTRRARNTATPHTTTIESPEFPPGLENDILYLPKATLLESSPSGLPPPEIFEEALNKLLITLHPQNQLRAVNGGKGSSRAIEPTLGLYCPIEGGDYIVDLTVHELAYQTGADVLILDAVQLAAGEWGPLGKAAAVLNLPDNPLHFSSPVASSGKMSPDDMHMQDDDLGEAPQPFMFSPSGRISFSVPKGLSPFPGRAMGSSSASKAATAKVDTFFEALVNLSLPAPESTDDKSDAAPKARPRLIYVRDFPTLAPSSPTWYSSLLAAAKQRRKAGSPVTIILGMTPPVTPPVVEAPPSPGHPNLMNLLMNRSATQQPGPSAKSDLMGDWDEGEAADIAREKRLKSRLRKWEKSSSDLSDEFPVATTTGRERGPGGASIIVIGSPDMPVPPLGMGANMSESAGQDESMFFRSSIIIPRTRSVQEERETRIARRREINELTMRMGIGAVGGIIEATPAQVALAKTSPISAQISATAASQALPVKPLWEDWGNTVEVWANVRKIADATIGRIMAAQGLQGAKNPAEPTVVPWAAVQAAWTSYHAMVDVRKSWLKSAIGHGVVVEDPADGKEGGLSKPGSALDPVVEALKNDPDLDTHEERLLPCIVNSASIKTTFNQVHLPTQTIDAVRTIVSLPLLHPHAFQQGILKDHGMTGCLLFGPPGTGKTLVVRALAKEAGCRMLAISPSDVMDMYVGEGEKLVRAVFALARKLSPCVVFLDEIDALFGARVSARESGSAFAHRGVITEFMQQMDGLKSSKEDNIIVIGATNRPFDLDDAVLRRLPRRLLVDLPGENERSAIFKILLRDETLAEDVNIDNLARKTDGFSGSDLKHLCVSAALDSIKQNAVLPWKSRHTQEVTASESNESNVPPAGEKASETPEAALATPDASPEPSSTTTAATPQTSPTTPAATPEATWTTSDATLEAPGTPASKSSSDGVAEPEVPAPALKPRILQLHNFTQALKEITPSSSEALGSLADLRKWNDEFGEGRRDRKKHQVWGKGRFGFINKPQGKQEEGKVAVTAEAKA